MTREEFTGVVAEVVDSLPKEFRARIRNVAVLVEDRPPEQEARRRRGLPAQDGDPDTPASGVLGSKGTERLLLGQFIGVPLTRKSTFQLPTGPDYVVLYQRNLERICRTREELRHQIRQTVIHEFGHYFGMSEDQLRDV